MKKTALFLAALALLMTFGGTATAEETTTLTGEYQWNHRDNSGDLKAEFTSTGDGTWDVSFFFKFRGEAHVYSGTAEGSLSSGKLSGTVKNEGKRRTFTFTGSFQDGTFSGTHAEVEDGKPFDTGTLTLKS
jgi:hypothetical protein